VSLNRPLARRKEAGARSASISGWRPMGCCGVRIDHGRSPPWGGACWVRFLGNAWFVGHGGQLVELVNQIDQENLSITLGHGRPPFAMR